MSASSVPSPIAPPLPEALLALAPLEMPNHRPVRYEGEDLSVQMDELAERDQVLLRDLYRQLTELLYSIADTSTADPEKRTAVRAWIERHDLDRVIDEVRELGRASLTRTPGESLAKAMHDVRGGALNSLLGRLQLFDAARATSAMLNTVFVHTRDHLKIMRNALVGLDEPRRQADRTPKAHAMQLMLDKWQEALIGPRWHEQPIRLHIDCRYEGPLTECCLESAAIDRIFYNLTNNAARHATDDQLDMVVFPLGASPCLRFVLSNQVSEEDVSRLRENGAEGKAEDSLAGLFEPAVSTTGSGFGLTVVADFVTNAFGLRDRAAALRARYLGAVLDGRTFRVWFHWPIAHGDMPQKLDDYHLPQQSLSEP